MGVGGCVGWLLGESLFVTPEAVVGVPEEELSRVRGTVPTPTKAGRRWRRWRLGRESDFS